MSYPHSFSNTFFQPFTTTTGDSPDALEQPFIEPPEYILDNREAQEDREFRILCEDFENCGIQLNAQIVSDVIVEKLQKSKRKYIEDVVRGIYGSLAMYQQCNGVEFVTARHFIDAYMKRKRELSTVLEHTHKDLQIVDRMLQQAEANLSRHASNNSKQIEDSKLTVQVVSVQNIPENDDEANCMYKVHLECQQQVIDTKPVYPNNSLAYFNEMFSFEVSSSEGDLRVRLMEVDGYSGSETFRGDCSIMLQDLTDQRKHELTKQVWGFENAEILVSAQWIYSKRLLYHQYLREFSAKREQKLRDMSEYQAQYDKLASPFECDEGSGLQGILDSGPEYVSRRIQDLMTNMKLTNWQIASQYLVSITFFLTCIASYSRCLFLDQAISGFAFWCNLEARRWSVNRYTVLLLGTILSMILDVFWIRVYFQEWTLNSVEADMHTITKIFSLFLFLWKIIIILFFWKCRRDAKKRSSYNNRISQMQEIARQSQQCPAPYSGGRQEHTSANNAGQSSSAQFYYSTVAAY